MSHRGHFCSGRMHYPLPASCLPVTIRKFTCYSHSPSLLTLNGTKSGCSLLVLRNFDLISSSIYIIPVKPVIVEKISCKVNPASSHSLRGAGPYCAVCLPFAPSSKVAHSQGPALVFPGTGTYPPLCLENGRRKYCYGINHEVVSIAIAQLILDLTNLCLSLHTSANSCRTKHS